MGSAIAGQRSDMQHTKEKLSQKDPIKISPYAKEWNSEKNKTDP